MISSSVNFKRRSRDGVAVHGIGTTRLKTYRFFMVGDCNKPNGLIESVKEDFKLAVDL